MADENGMDVNVTSGPVRVVSFGTALFGVGAVIAVALLTSGGLGSPEKFAVLLLLQAANYAASGWLSRRFNTPVWNLDAALLVASLVLLEPLGVVLGQSVGALLGDLTNRRPWY